MIHEVMIRTWRGIFWRWDTEVELAWEVFENPFQNVWNGQQQMDMGGLEVDGRREAPDGWTRTGRDDGASDESGTHLPQPKFSPQALPFLLVTCSVDGLYVGGCWSCTRRCRQTAAGATPPCILAVCTDERRDGPSRVYAPQRPGARRRLGPGGERETNYTVTLRLLLHPRDLLCRNRWLFRQFPASMVHFLPVKCLLRPCLTEFIRYRVLLVKLRRTYWNSLLFRNR